MTIHKWVIFFYKSLLLDGVWILEAVSCRHEPAAGDQRGATHMAVAFHLQADLPRPRARARIWASYYLSPLPGPGAAAFRRDRGNQNIWLHLKKFWQSENMKVAEQEISPQRSSSEPSKQSLTPSHSGLLLLRHFPLAHLYEDEEHPLRSEESREAWARQVWHRTLVPFGKRYEYSGTKLL